MPKAKHEWATLDPRIDHLKAQGWTDTQIAKDLGISRQTFVDHLRSRESVHPSTPETTDITEVHQGTPEHPGTLEGYQEVMEDVQHSVPEAPYIGIEKVDQSTPEHQSVPQQLDIPE
jgi:orotate phosphoribosyltransferase-like protein